MKNAGVALPESKYEHSDLWAVFPFTARDGVENTPVKTTQETTQETTREKIIESLKLNLRITRKGLAEQTGITTDGVKYHLKWIKERRGY